MAQSDLGPVIKKKNRSKDGIEDESKSLIKGQALDSQSMISVEKKKPKKSKMDTVKIPKEPEIDFFADYEYLPKPRT